MKTLFQSSMKLASVLLLLFGGAAITAHAQGARLQMDQLDSLAHKASETVDVKLDERLMQTTAKIFSEKDDAEIRELLKGLKGIYVKSFEFEKEGQYSPADVESVMSQLRGGAWSKIVGVMSKKDGDNVEVYLMMQGDEIQGLAVVSAEPKEFAVVKAIEQFYHVKHESIPLLARAGIKATRTVARIKGGDYKRLADAGSVRLAIFEDQEFNSRGQIASFKSSMQNTLKDNWSQLIQTLSAKDEEQTYIYMRDAGPKFHVLIVTIER